MRALCITLALVTLAGLPAQARGYHFARIHFFHDTAPKRDRIALEPAPLQPAFVVRYRTVWYNGLKFRIPYVAQKLHCYSPSLCVPMFRKVKP